VKTVKFIHTADWHLGKLVHGIYMTEDQKYILNQFVELIEEEQPDAVIIAGDLYDRSVPPTDAVELLNDVLFRINVELKIPIIAISGNHDSAERLSFGKYWYKNSQFHLIGKLEKDVEPISINGLNFYSIPYAEPGIVRAVLDNDSIHTHQEAMKAIIQRIELSLNKNEPNIFVGHAFVLGGKTSDSERSLTVGGSGCVTADLFEPFAYTALGHLHSPDAIKHETVMYSGSLLKYSFSEAKQKKSISIIEMQPNGQFELRYKSLKPKHDMREIEGYMEELLDPGFYQKQDTEDYLKITLLDEGALLDPMGKLRQVFPNVLHLERKIETTDRKKKQNVRLMMEEKKSELDLFEQFYTEMTTLDFTEEKRNVMSEVIENVRKKEGV
jgi:exonuclease SbcD